ncbi:MAG: hypothetical protein K8R79_08255, partial [Calditrichales bacterium]|nr:hypothetical protein [Calditrichales bacterium]
MDEEQEIQELVEKFICHYKRAKSNYKKGQSLLKRSFEDYVESGKVVKELKLLIKKRGLKWEDFCKPHLGI